MARIGLLPRVRCLRSLIYANTPRRRDFSLFGVFDRFVESLACGMPRKPASIGEGTFQIATKGIILSRVVTKEAVFCQEMLGGSCPLIFETNFQGKRFLFRSQLQAQASEAIRAVGMALPPTLRVASVISR